MTEVLLNPFHCDIVILSYCHILYLFISQALTSNSMPKCFHSKVLLHRCHLSIRKVSSKEKPPWRRKQPNNQCTQGTKVSLVCEDKSMHFFLLLYQNNPVKHSFLVLFCLCAFDYILISKKIKGVIYNHNKIKEFFATSFLQNWNILGNILKDFFF